MTSPPHLSLKAPSVASRIECVQSACGVTAWLVEDHSRPSITVSFAFRGGAALDFETKAGRAALMTNLLLEGAGELPGEHFQIALADAAIDLEMSCKRDHISGTMRLLNTQVGPAFELLKIALHEPHFTPTSLDKARAARASLLALNMMNPTTAARDAFMRRAFDGHAYGVSMRRQIADLPSITTDDLANVHASAITRSNAVVTVVGSIMPEELSELLDIAFGDLPSGSKITIPDCRFNALGEEIVTGLDGPQAGIVFGRPAVLIDDGDIAPAKVVVQAVGGGFTSRLITELREKRGLCYSVGASLELARGRSTIVGETTTASEHTSNVLDVIRSEVAKVLKEGLTSEEIDNNKGFLEGSLRMQLSSSATTARVLVETQLDDRTPDWLDTRLQHLAAVTPERITHVLPKLLGDGSLLVSIASETSSR